MNVKVYSTIKGHNFQYNLIEISYILIYFFFSLTNYLSISCLFNNKFWASFGARDEFKAQDAYQVACLYSGYAQTLNGFKVLCIWCMYVPFTKCYVWEKE